MLNVDGSIFFHCPYHANRYLYADLFANGMWVGTENPTDSGNFTRTQILFRCAQDRPIQCSVAAGSSLPSLGYIFCLLHRKTERKQNKNVDFNQ